MPSGTKASDGCSVGSSGGRGVVKKTALNFDESIELSTEWGCMHKTDQNLFTTNSVQDIFNF